MKEPLKIRAFHFSVDIIQFLSNLPQGRVYYIVSDQLIRSATSIGANIIEAQAASSKKDFINFFHIALKSANETQYWLEILKEGTRVDNAQVDKLLMEVKEIAKILGASLVTMKKPNH